MDKRKFWNEVVPKNVKNDIRTGGVLGILSFCITAALAVFFSPLILFDAIIVLVLALGVLLGKSRICSIVILAYYLYGQIMMRVSGEFEVTNGIFMVVIYVIGYLAAIRGTFKYHKLKKQYQQQESEIDYNKITGGI